MFSEQNKIAARRVARGSLVAAGITHARRYLVERRST